MSKLFKSIYFYYFLIVILSALLTFTYLYFSNRILNQNTPKVLGIDVSVYQGDIDWPKIEDQDIKFAYIKATEGEDYLDSNFNENWKNIKSTSIYYGAYLFFDFKANPEKMAEYFIKNVPNDPYMLPPCVDIELPDDSTQINIKDSQNKLRTLIEKLNENYQIKPIIYSNIKTSQEILQNEFDDYNLWICDISNNLPEIDKDWTFWQYSFRGILNGIESDNTFVDLDVYNGNLDEFTQQYKPSIFR